MSTLVIKYEPADGKTTQVVPIMGEFTYVELTSDDEKKNAFLQISKLSELPESFDIREAPYAYILADFGEGMIKRYLVPGMFATVLNDNAKRVFPI